MIHKTSVIFVLSLIAFASALPQLPVSLSSTTQKKTEASNTWTSTTTSGTASSSLIVSDIASASSSGSVWSTATPSSATSGGVDSSSTVWGSATSAAESANTATSTSAWNVGTTTPEATVTSAIGSTGTINSTIATSASIKESTSSSDAWSTATATATSSVSTSASTAATPIPTSAEDPSPAGADEEEDDGITVQFNMAGTNLGNGPRINYTQPGFEWDIDLGLTIENYKKNNSGFLYELAINGSYVSSSSVTNATIPFACGRRIASSIDIPANASVPISVPTMFYRYNLTLPDPVVSGVISTCGAPHIEGGIIMETSPAIVTSWDVKAKYTVFKAAVEGTVTVPQYKEKEWKGLRVEIPCPDLLREKALTKTCAAEKPKE